ncbi:MAG: ABC transporter substrate-binding protein [Dehalococcoidia bacterium]|nr:MAG: ABC transporter substrate-binding protein [Dehalococcoidia bacterium]
MRTLVGGLALCALLFSSCAPAGGGSTGTGGSAPGATREPARAAQQVLRVGTNALPATMSPESSTVNIPLYWSQFDSLVRFDKDFNVQPSVATKWELLPDRSAWRFTIRDDLYFPNGQQLTAADVEFTINTSIANRAAQLALTPLLTGAKLIDEKTVDLQMSAMDVSVLINGTDWFIFPKSYYESVGRDFGQRPMGSGPYEISEYRPGDSVTYKLRTDRPHPFRKPNLTEIRFRAIPDSGAAVNGLRAGEVDLLIGSYSTYTPEQAENAKAAGMTVITLLPSSSYILFDRSANEKTESPLLDKRVRLAMNYAVDRETMAKTVYKGYAQPLGQIPLPGQTAYDPNVKPYPYDVATAKRLLAEAGYPNGFKLTGGLAFPASALNQSAFLAVQDFHRQIGIDYPIQSVEFASYQDLIFVRNGKVRQEMMASGAQNTNGLMAWGILRCGQPLVYWCNPEYDRFMAQAYAELDPARRAELFKQANKAFLEEATAIILVAQPQFTMHNPKVAGLNIVTPVFYNLDSVYRLE